MAATGQFSCPPAGRHLAVSGQFLVTVVTDQGKRFLLRVLGLSWLYPYDADRVLRASINLQSFVPSSGDPTPWPDLPTGSQESQTPCSHGSAGRREGTGMRHRRRPHWDLERVIRLTVTAANAAASLIDALRRFR